ncbi:hypothetical protein DL96DRAFT_1635762 [Flagelloscypha sp. PMI_526]|nr:hypothetical protein DL96DRAFT_1635762 [Flagelloscypha sp. PMI_526]
MGLASTLWSAFSVTGAFVFPEGPCRWIFWAIVPLGSLHILSLALNGSFEPSPEASEFAFPKFRTHYRIAGYAVLFMVSTKIAQVPMYVAWYYYF